jgi:hypothetical protein
MVPRKILADPNIDYIYCGECFELILKFTGVIEKDKDFRDLEDLVFVKDDKIVLNPYCKHIFKMLIACHH